MTLKDKVNEIQRLIDAFEVEASKFHEITFNTFYITQDGGPSLTRKFLKPNHAIMLWQYYGLLDNDENIKQFAENLSDSDMKWGIRGSALSFMGVIEGNATPLLCEWQLVQGAFSMKMTHGILNHVYCRK